MPFAAPKPCAHPLCKQLVSNGQRHCDEHRKELHQQVDSRRGNSAQRGYGHRWRKARETFLRRHPLCAACSSLERPVLATLVDHITPHGMSRALESGDPAAVDAAQALFWDTDNWQPLCAPCHSAKTAAEDGGFGNPTRT